MTNMWKYKAFKIVAKKFNRIKLILVGYGPEHENIIKFAKYLNIYNKIIIIKAIIMLKAIITFLSIGLDTFSLNLNIYL